MITIEDQKTATLTIEGGPKGDTGPVGPEGPQGPIGPQGLIGPAGIVASATAPENTDVIWLDIS